MHVIHLSICLHGDAQWHERKIGIDIVLPYSGPQGCMPYPVRGLLKSMKPHICPHATSSYGPHDTSSWYT